MICRNGAEYRAVCRDVRTRWFAGSIVNGGTMINLGPASFGVQVACKKAKHHQTCNICHKKRRTMASVFHSVDPMPGRLSSFSRLQICRFCLNQMAGAINQAAQAVGESERNRDKTPEKCQDATSEPTGCAAADKTPEERDGNLAYRS